MDNRFPPLSIHIPQPSPASSEDQSQRTPFQSPAHTNGTPTISNTPPRHPRSSRSLLQGGSLSPARSNASSPFAIDSQSVQHQRRSSLPNGIAFPIQSNSRRPSNASPSAVDSQSVQHQRRSSLSNGSASPIQSNSRRLSNAASIEWGTEASSTIHHQGSDATADGMIPTILNHDTLVRFTRFPNNINGLILEQTDECIEELMDRFGFPSDGSAFYNPDLNVCGLTRPNEDPDIGPMAFNDVLNQPGNSERRELDPHSVALQVVLTIAHELSHARQFDTFPMIVLEGMDDEIAELPELDQLTTKLALLHQKALMETLAYHSEIVNMTAFINHNIDDLSEAKLVELKALRDVSVDQRDKYFDTLPRHIAELVLSNHIDEALREIRQNIPEEFIRNPN